MRSRMVVKLLAAATVLAALTAGSCGNPPVPRPPAPPSPVPATSAPPPAPATPRTVQPGAFCDTAGERGVTKTGTPMECKGPGDLRWRQTNG